MNAKDVSSQKVDCHDDEGIPEECDRSEVALYNRLTKVGAIASSKSFRILGLVITVLFLIWQGIDADYNAAPVLCEAEPVFQAVHMIFFLFFGTEALVRFSAVRDKRQVLKYRALIWDMILVVFLFVRMAVRSISSSSTRKVLMVAFLLQFTRQARLFKMPRKANSGSLKVEAAKELLRCFLLIVFLHYFFATAISKITQDTEAGEQYFPTVERGIQNLWHVSDVAGALLAESKAYKMPYLAPYLAFLVRCKVTVMLTIRNILVQIRTSQASQSKCTSAATDNNSEEIAERV